MKRSPNKYNRVETILIIYLLLLLFLKKISFFLEIAEQLDTYQDIIYKVLFLERNNEKIMKKSYFLTQKESFE